MVRVPWTRKNIHAIYAVAIFGGAAFIAALASQFLRYGTICWVDETQPVQVTGTPWSLHIQLTSCSALDAGNVVLAVNGLTGQKVEVAHEGNGYYPNIRIVSPARVELVFDSLAAIMSRTKSFGNVKVMYRSVSAQDADQKGYDFWLDHPDDPRAVRWEQDHSAEIP